MKKFISYLWKRGGNNVSDIQKSCGKGFSKI